MTSSRKFSFIGEKSYITKQLLTSISVDIRIYLPLKVISLGWVDEDIRIYLPLKVISLLRVDKSRSTLKSDITFKSR